MLIVIYSDIVLRSNHLIGSKLSIHIADISKVSRILKCCTTLAFKQVISLPQNKRILGKFSTYLPWNTLDAVFNTICFIFLLMSFSFNFRKILMMEQAVFITIFILDAIWRYLISCLTKNRIGTLHERMKTSTKNEILSRRRISKLGMLKN